MRSKAPLALMEQVVMALVFALAAALCVQAFTLAGHISRADEVRDRALLQAQNVAETLKSTGGDYAAAAQQFGGNWDGVQWIVSLDADFQPVSDGNAVYVVQILPKDSENPLLGTAQVTVRDADGAALAELPAAWQKAVTA